MSFHAATAAQAMYRAGKPDEALAVAARILADNPYEVEAHMTVALVMLRRNAVAETLDSLKKCVAARPAEWVLERMRQDFTANGRPPLQRDMAFKLGAYFRSNLGELGPSLPSEHRRATHEYMNLVGTSYVRSFGGSPAFFPVFIGMGPTMLMMTEAQAAVTHRKFHENLKRLDLSRNTMLVVGGDPYYRVIELQKSQADRPGGVATDEDFALMDLVAERHGPILADAQAQVTGKLMLLAATPTHNDLMNQLCVRLNTRLKAMCEAAGVIFIDWWDELADPVSGHLKDEYCANAYPGDIHFSLPTTKRFMELLKADGLFSEAVVPSCAFEWSHVFECQVEASERTRIWCEPNVTPRNAFQSHKIASSHLSTRLAELLTCLGAQYADQTFLMVNVRDGFMPVIVPPQVHAGCLALTDTAENLQVGQAVLDFYGRPDVRLKLSDDLSVVEGRSFGQVVLLVHPDTVGEDERRCNEVLARIGATPSIIVGTPFPERLGALNLGQRQTNLINISNRHVPEQWRNYAIVVVR
jgi:hypothetical protein